MTDEVPVKKPFAINTSLSRTQTELLSHVCAQNDWKELKTSKDKGSVLWLVRGEDFENRLAAGCDNGGSFLSFSLAPHCFTAAFHLRFFDAKIMHTAALLRTTLLQQSDRLLYIAHSPLHTTVSKATKE